MPWDQWLREKRCGSVFAAERSVGGVVRQRNQMVLWRETDVEGGTCRGTCRGISLWEEALRECVRPQEEASRVVFVRGDSWCCDKRVKLRHVPWGQ